MSYGPDFLSKEKDKRRTIKAKQLRGRAAVEEEGIVTSRLPAYTDILKIRSEIIYGFVGIQVNHKIIFIRKMYGCKIPKVRGCNSKPGFKGLRHLAGSLCVRILRYEITLLFALQCQTCQIHIGYPWHLEVHSRIVPEPQKELECMSLETMRLYSHATFTPNFVPLA